MTRRARLLATSLAILLGIVLLSAGPAQAFDPGTGDDETPTDPGQEYGDTRVGSVQGCSLVSSPNYMGVTCGDGHSGRAVDVKAILGGSPVPNCWHEPLTDAELQAMGLQSTAGPEGSTYYWLWCVTGISKRPNKFDPQFTVGIEEIPNGGDVLLLDERQRELVRLIPRNRMIPIPIAGVSPMAHPRVGAWVSFFEGNSEPVEVDAGGVLMRAHVEKIVMEPLGKGAGDLVTCSGRGHKAARGENPTNTPNGCWYQYEQSSAGEPDARYATNIIAHWRVRVSSDGGATWTDFNRFTKSQITTMPVTEIQTVVVG